MTIWRHKKKLINNVQWSIWRCNTSTSRKRRRRCSKWHKTITTHFYTLHHWVICIKRVVCKAKDTISVVKTHLNTFFSSFFEKCWTICFKMTKVIDKSTITKHEKRSAEISRVLILFYQSPVVWACHPNPNFQCRRTEWKEAVRVSVLYPRIRSCFSFLNEHKRHAEKWEDLTKHNKLSSLFIQ